MPSDRKMIGVRLSEEARAEVAKLAEAQHRSLSNMCEILVLAGLRAQGAPDDQLVKVVGRAKRK